MATEAASLMRLSRPTTKPTDMPYRVLDEEGLAELASPSSKYHIIIESALNRMEAQGYQLVAIEQATDDQRLPLYIFHKPEQQRRRTFQER